MSVIVKSASIGSNIVTDGLVIMLDAGNVKSYPGSGLVWYDLSGNENNGTLDNVIYDGDMNFDGTGTVDGVTPGSNVIINENITNTSNYSNGCTYNIWFNVNNSAVNRMSLFYGANTIRHIELYSSNKYFRTEAALQNGYSFGSGVFTDNVRNQWSNISIVFANNETNRPVRWYQNGKLFYTGSLDNGTYTGTEYFSFSRIGRSTGYAKSFHGKINLFSIYSKILTDNEILQNYNVIKNRFGL